MTGSIVQLENSAKMIQTAKKYLTSYSRMGNDDPTFNHLTIQVNDTPVECWICNRNTFSTISKSVAEKLGINMKFLPNITVEHNFGFPAHPAPICALTVKFQDRAPFLHPFVIFDINQECMMGNDLYPLLGVKISILGIEL